MRNLLNFQRRWTTHLDEADLASVESKPRTGDGPARGSLRLGIARTAAIPLAVCVVAGAFVWWFGQTEEAQGSQAITLSTTASGPAPRLGKEAPGFQLTSLDGVPIDLQSYRGQPIWITFWASWCPPCRAESPEISAAFERHAQSDLVIVAIDVGEDPAAVAEYVERARLPFLVGLDRTTDVAAQYRVRGLPTHYFVDADGVLHDMKIGPMGSKEIERRLASLMEGATR